MHLRLFPLIMISIILNHACSSASDPKTSIDEQADIETIPVIFDTDANNELDDQHALAYLLTNQDVFDIIGITVNATRNGGLIEGHYKEALRILTLFNERKLPLKNGANKTFGEIRGDLASARYDGMEAVEFIIEQSRAFAGRKIIVIAVGKLTNVALAIEKAPEITDKIQLVWLGSNYPEPGEYNLENDTSALSYLLETDLHFEMVNVAYGSTRGTDYIKISLAEVDSIMPGKGPKISEGITGRHGGSFNCFGDYSVNLFHHIDLYGDPPSRSLYDVGAVAIVKHPDWAESRIMAAPKYADDQWIERPENNRKIILWENFNKEAIIEDFCAALDK